MLLDGNPLLAMEPAGGSPGEIGRKVFFAQIAVNPRHFGPPPGGEDQGASAVPQGAEDLMVGMGFHGNDPLGHGIDIVGPPDGMAGEPVMKAWNSGWTKPRSAWTVRPLDARYDFRVGPKTIWTPVGRLASLA